MGELVHLRDRNPWRDSSQHELFRMFIFIEQCGDKLPHRLHVELFYRKQMSDQEKHGSLLAQFSPPASAT